jgi:adenylate kinase
MRRGALVPDSAVREMVGERLACLHCGGEFILNGFPRTLALAESLNQLLDTEGIWSSAVLSYELWASEIVGRLAGRRACEKWKAAYQVTERPPKLEGRCDRCDGKLFQRDDDRPESIKVRLETDEQGTARLIDLYNKLGLLVQVAATETPDEIFYRTVGEMESRRVRVFAYKLSDAGEKRR